MKSLYITSLKVPLLNALNIKINMKKEESADLLLENDLPDIEEIAKRIEQLGIFENVYIFENKPIDGIKKYVKNQTRKTIQECIYNSGKEFIYNVKSKIYKEYKFKNKILYCKDVNLKLYDKLYLCSFSDFVFNTIDIMYKHNLKEISILEGSIKDYLFDASLLFLNRYTKCIVNIYIYDKYCIVWEGRYNINIYNIKKLDKNDNAFVKKINYIFNVPDNLELINNKIIFFDQVAEPMPLYLKKYTFLKKLLLRNAYTKHKIEDDFFCIKSRIFEELYYLCKTDINIFKKLCIKLHPRTNKGIPKKYYEFSLIGERNNRNNIPWEIYLLNNKIKNCILITMYSTSIISEIYNFNNYESNNRFILLYKLYNIEYMKDKKETDLFINKLKNKCNKLYAVESKEELISVLFNEKSND